MMHQKKQHLLLTADWIGTDVPEDGLIGRIGLIIGLVMEPGFLPVATFFRSIRHCQKHQLKYIQ
jgi:hypothetical protein